MLEIKNLTKAAERIREAIKNNERIILYGDSDPDGVASVVILKETMEQIASVGPKIAVYFPDRAQEGYGINEQALKYLSNNAPALLIALDCGIGNVKEVELAGELGFEVMIIDHHQVPPNTLPRASIIVNPKQKDDDYPFKHFACAGIVYRLAGFLVPHGSKWPVEEAVSLAGLATLADQMSLSEENEKLVRDGILALSYTKRKGLRALMDLTGFRAPNSPSALKDKNYIGEIRQKILPLLNSAGLQDHLNEAYLLLIENSRDEAENRIKVLMEKAVDRKKEIQRILMAVESRILSGEREEIVFEGDASWELPCLGPAASKICQKYDMPTFLFKKQKEKSRGAVRMPSAMDGVKAMTACASLLQGYGGHAPAAGFSVKNDNLEKFRECLQKYFRIDNPSEE